MIKGLCVLLFLFGLWYMVIPYEGTGKKNYEMTSYYTNNRRNIVTDQYKKEFQSIYCANFDALNLFCFLKPLKINHSPTLAATFFTAKQKSTYLEEYFYPLRGSIVANGYEPYDLRGMPFNKSSTPLLFNGRQYPAEISVRYNTSNIFSRVLIYILIWLCIYFEVKFLRSFLKRFD